MESTLSEENVVRNDEQIDKEILPQLEIKLKDLVRQVSGALKYYESKPDSKPVAKIYLSGGNSKLANLGIYLQAKLERNVEILDKPNPRLRISKKAELSDCLPILDIAIGAALRRLIQFKNTINLLPFEHLLQEN